MGELVNTAWNTSTPSSEFVLDMFIGCMFHSAVYLLWFCTGMFVLCKYTFCPLSKCKLEPPKCPPELSGGELGSKNVSWNLEGPKLRFDLSPSPPTRRYIKIQNSRKSTFRMDWPPQKMHVASVKVFCCCVYLPFPALFALRTQISKSSQFLPPTLSKCYLHVVRCFWENVSYIFEGVQKAKIVSYIFSRPPPL